MVAGVKALGLETCVTLGMLKRRPGRAAARGRARLLQPQPRHLARVLRPDHHHARLPATASTRSSACAAPASTSAAAASSAWASRGATAPAMISQLANLDPHPESVPINALVPVEGRLSLKNREARRRWSSSAPSPRRASPCRRRGCGSPRAARACPRAGAGAVLPRRRQFGVLRREAAHHRQPAGAQPISALFEQARDERPHERGDAGTSVRDGVAVISMNNPPVNGLSNALRAAIMENLEKADKDAAVKAVGPRSARRKLSPAAPTSASSTVRASSPTFRTSTTGRTR